MPENINFVNYSDLLNWNETVGDALRRKYNQIREANNRIKDLNSRIKSLENVINFYIKLSKPIRCEDCLHNDYGNHCDALHCFIGDENFYCSWGEKNEN